MILIDLTLTLLYNGFNLLYFFLLILIDIDKC